jgi:hypothetical protein
MVDRFPGRVFGLSPEEWDGEVFVGEVGSVDHTDWDVQLTYLDRLPIPNFGVAIVSLQCPQSIQQELFLPDVLSSFVMRFDADSILALDDPQHGVFQPTNFESREHDVRSETRPQTADRQAIHFRHRNLPFQVLQFQSTNHESVIVLGGWKQNVLPLAPKLVVVDKVLARRLQ